MSKEQWILMASTYRWVSRHMPHLRDIAWVGTYKAHHRRLVERVYREIASES